MSLEQQFIDAISSYGIPASGPLLLDGKLRRYNVQGDRKGKRNGWYRFVRLRDDFAYGSFGCNKRGVSGKWSSKHKIEWTAYDQKLMKKKALDAQKAHELEQARAAEKANALWKRLSICEAHPYSDKKGIALYGTKKMVNSLVIPVYVDNYISSLQFIDGEGGKRFLTNGNVKGGYFWLGAETDEVYLCEGYATAASIHEATRKHVVMAFNAGNLVTVAHYMRGKMPDKKIIIASDNDHKTPGNPGLSKALDAADKIGATVVTPKSEDGITDWNDYHYKYGIDALRRELTGEKKKEIVIADDKLWRTSLIEGKEERPGYPAFDAKSKKNTFLFLQNHENFKNKIAYNIFTDKILMLKCPDWRGEEQWTPRELLDYDAAMIICSLEVYGIKTSKDVVLDYINYLANENRINPPRDYFESLKWDGKPRLDEWLIYYLGASGQTFEYLKLVGSKWIIGAVARIYNPGCKCDNVLILEGEQGIKKTTAFETLATFGNESYFLEFSGDIEKKDTLMEFQGKLIIEMAELASMAKSEIEVMKAFISKRIDEYRPPYGRAIIKRPRFFVIGASTNNSIDDEYFIDPTGARRFWPVSCVNIDLDALKNDCPQLWAEAVYRYKAGEKHWLEDDEIAVVKEEQDKRRSIESITPRVEIACKNIELLVREIEVDTVINELGYPIQAINNRLKSTIKKSLRECGYREIRRSKSDRTRIWRKE